MATHRLYIEKDGHRITAAHMTVFADGTKERLHGHNYQVSASLDLPDVSFAHFFDFGLVKRALGELCEQLDQRFLVAERCPLQTIERRAGEVELRLCGKRYVVPEEDVAILPIDNVVVEQLALELNARLRAKLAELVAPGTIAAVEVAVEESPGQGSRCRVELLPPRPEK